MYHAKKPKRKEKYERCVTAVNTKGRKRYDAKTESLSLAFLCYLQSPKYESAPTPIQNGDTGVPIRLWPEVTIGIEIHGFRYENFFLAQLTPQRVPSGIRPIWDNYHASYAVSDHFFEYATN